MSTARATLLSAVAAAACSVLLSPLVRGQEPPASEVPPAPTQPAQAQEPQPEQDPVVAIVGTLELRESELLAELNRQIPLVYYHQKVPQGQMDELRRKALDKLIEKTLIFQDAIARNLKVSDAEIRETFQKTLQASGEEFQDVSPERFEQLLTQFRALVRRKLLIDKNEERFRSSIPKPDEAALQAVYERMAKDSPDALRSPAEARLRHIFIGVDPASTDQEYDRQQAKIDAVVKGLQEGRSFAELAKQYSEDEAAQNGGDVGFVKQARFFKTRQLDDAAFVLQPGERSPVVRTIYGFHMIECVAVVPRRLYTIDETRPLLEEWFSTEHHRNRREIWLAEVREKMGVKILALDLQGPVPSKGQPIPAPKSTEPAKQGG